MAAGPRPQRPLQTGLYRVFLALVCAAGGAVAGLAGGMLVASVAEGLGLGLGSLVFGSAFGLLGAGVGTASLYARTGLGSRLGAVASVPAVAGTIGYAAGRLSGSAVGVSIAIVAPVAVALLAFVTDPDRPVKERRGRRIALAGLLGIVVLAAIPPVVSDLRRWRNDTAALERLGDPPLAPAAAGLAVEKLFAYSSRLDYTVVDGDGTAFATVHQEQVDSRPVVSDDCFGAELGGPPMVGCLEVAPGVYRAENRNGRRNASYFVPREHSVGVVRALVTDESQAEYGEQGPGDEQLERIARSLRPVPVQDLARLNCRLCRLMPR